MIDPKELTKERIPYSEEKNNKYFEKTKKLLEEMPEYCNDYYEHLMANDMGASTIHAYIADLNLFFKYLVRNSDAHVSEITMEKLDDLTPSDIERYMAYLRYYNVDGISHQNNPSGRKRKLASLRRFFKFAREHQHWLENDPAAGAATPRVKTKDPTQIRVVEQRERERLFERLERMYKDAERDRAATNNPKYRVWIKPAFIKRDTAIIYLFLGTGIRVSELVGLDVDNVDWEAGKAVIVRKGGDKDTIYMSDDVLGILKEYKNYWRNMLAPDTPALFVSKTHTRLTVRAVEAMIKDLAEELFGKGCNITPHKFRATFDSQYYRMTLDLEATRNAMHHKSVSTTSQYYLKANEKAKEDDMKRLNVFGD